MIPDRLQYFLDDFWNFKILVKIWPILKGKMSWWCCCCCCHALHGIALNCIAFAFAFAWHLRLHFHCMVLQGHVRPDIEGNARQFKAIQGNAQGRHNKTRQGLARQSKDIKAMHSKARQKQRQRQRQCKYM